MKGSFSLNNVLVLYFSTDTFVSRCTKLTVVSRIQSQLSYMIHKHIVCVIIHEMPKSFCSRDGKQWVEFIRRSFAK
jgi:hypothetical protein